MSQTQTWSGHPCSHRGSRPARERIESDQRHWQADRGEMAGDPQATNERGHELVGSEGAWSASIGCHWTLTHVFSIARTKNMWQIIIPWSRIKYVHQTSSQLLTHVIHCMILNNNNHSTLIPGRIGPWPHHPGSDHVCFCVLFCKWISYVVLVLANNQTIHGSQHIYSFCQ